MDKNNVKFRAVCCGMLLTAASTGIFSNSIAVFIAPVCSDLGFDRSGFSLISSITLLASLAALPLFGRLLSKVHLRYFIALASFVCCGCVLAYSFCSKLCQFYIAAAIYGFFVNGITLLTFGALLRRLDIEITGSISGSAFAGAGAASFVFIPLLQKITECYGWRTGYRLQFAVGSALLLAAVFIIPAAAKHPHQAVRNVSFFAVFKYPAMPFAAAALFIINAINLALFNHSAAYLTSLGLPSSSSSMISAWAALLSSFSKPAFGFMADKFGLKTASAILSGSLLFACLAALLLPLSKAAFYIFPVLLSLCSCSSYIPANLFASRLFDRCDYSAASSALTFAATVGSAFGPPLAGFIFDRFGSYCYMWISSAAAAILSFGLMILSLSRSKHAG